MARLVPATHEPDELENHDERAGCGLGEAEAVHHLSGFQPGEILNSALCDVGQHRVRAAESDDCGFAEKNSFPENGVIGAEKSRDKNDRSPPNQQPRDGHADRS